LTPIFLFVVRQILSGGADCVREAGCGGPPRRINGGSPNNKSPMGVLRPLLAPGPRQKRDMAKGRGAPLFCPSVFGEQCIYRTKTICCLPRE